MPTPDRPRSRRLPATRREMIRGIAVSLHELYLGFLAKTRPLSEIARLDETALTRAVSTLLTDGMIRPGRWADHRAQLYVPRGKTAED